METKIALAGSVGSKFADLVKTIFTKDDGSSIRALYIALAEGWINPELEIIVSDMVKLEELEGTIRLLSRLNFYYGDAFELDTITVRIFGEVNEEYIVWFVQFFSALENSELSENAITSIPASDEIKEIFLSDNCDEAFDLAQMKFTRESFPVTVEKN